MATVQLQDFRFDGRKLVPGMPEHASLLSSTHLYWHRLTHEQANVTTSVGKVAMYVMYFALASYLLDHKITPPTALQNEVRKSYGLIPQAEMKRLKMPDMSRVGTSKTSFRDKLPELIRWNRKIRENTRIPEDERKLLTYAIRIGKAGVSESSVRNIEKLAWVLSPELGGKVTQYLHGKSDNSPGTSKKSNASGATQLQAALKAQVKALGGTGYTLNLDHAATAKAKAPVKYKEYLRLRADLRKRFETDFRQLIIGNENKPLPVDKAEKAMRDKGYELLFIPTKSMGFLGKVGLQNGKISLFTMNDKLLMGGVAPGATVKMNPAYKDGADNAYYMTVKVPGAVTKGSRIYTAEYKGRSVTSKFKKAEQLASNLPTLTRRWMEDAKSTDGFTAMAGTAAAVLYMTGARVGSNASGMASRKGVAAFGILNARAKHVKVTATNIIFTYPGKKGVAQKHTIALNKPATKVLAANIKKYLANKGPNDMLWETASPTGRKTVALSYNDFNRYIKSMGFTQGAHKLRHVRGTQLTEQLLEKVPWKPSKSANTLAKRKKEAEAYMKDKILSKVADLLGHRSATKTGGTKPAWSTSISSYVMPDIVREWFVKNDLDVPKWVPARVAAD